MHVTLEPAQFEKLGAIIETGEPGTTDEIAADGAVVVAQGNEYRLWYTATSATGSVIRGAHSTSPTQWADTAPVDLPAPEGLKNVPEPSRPGSHVRDPFVLHHQRLWYMWYTRAHAAEVRAKTAASIFCCTSSDGRAWLGHEAALAPGGDLGTAAVAEPSVARDSERNVWLMAYAESDGTRWRIGLAESVDLLRWNPHGMILDTWGPDVTHCRTPRLLRWGRDWLLVFTALRGGRWGVYRTFSTDTVWWSTPQPLLEPTLPSETGGLRAAFPLVIGDDMYVFYGACAKTHWLAHLARHLFPGAGADTNWRTHLAIARGAGPTVGVPQ